MSNIEIIYDINKLTCLWSEVFKNDVLVISDLISVRDSFCARKEVTVSAFEDVIITHGILPYKMGVIDEGIKGINWGKSKRNVKKNSKKYFLDSNNRIYRDKMLELMFLCDITARGEVVKRLLAIYPNIFLLVDPSSQHCDEFNFIMYLEGKFHPEIHIIY